MQVAIESCSVRLRSMRTLVCRDGLTKNFVRFTLGSKYSNFVFARNPDGMCMYA